MWNETVAARGGQTVVCYINKYFGELPNVTEEINIHNNCCPGQHRNIYVAVRFLLKI